MLGFVGRIGGAIRDAAGAVGTWFVTQRESVRENKPTWRDTSLDDWRRERDAEIERERQLRAQRGEVLQTGAGNEEQAETVRQERIGG